MSDHDNKDDKKWKLPSADDLQALGSKALGAINGVALGLFSSEKFISAIEKLQANLGFLSLIIAILGLPFYLYGLIHALEYSKERDLSRATKVVITFSNIVLTVMGIIAAAGLVYIATPILLIVGAAKGFVESIWNLGLSISNRFFGQAAADAREIKTLREKINNNWPPTDEQLKRLTYLTNEQRRRNGNIAEATHTMALNTVGLIACGLLFAGVTAPAGAGILFGLAIYGGLDAAGLNPVKLVLHGINFLSKKIRGKPLFDPFGPKNELALKAELAKKFGKTEMQIDETHKPISPAATHTSDATVMDRLQNGKTTQPEATELSVPSKRHIFSSYLKLASIFTTVKGTLKKGSGLKQQEDDENEGDSKKTTP